MPHEGKPERSSSELKGLHIFEAGPDGKLVDASGHVPLTTFTPGIRDAIKDGVNMMRELVGGQIVPQACCPDAEAGASGRKSSVGGGGAAYEDGWERIFGRPPVNFN